MEKSFSLQQIANLLEGELEGDPGYRVYGIADLSSADHRHIAFVAKKSYEPYLLDTGAGAAIVASATITTRRGLNLIRVSDPYRAYATLSALFSRRPVGEPGIHQTAVVHPSAQLGSDVSIGPFCVIEADAVIGDRSELLAHVFVGAGSSVGADCLLYTHAALYHATQIGNRVTIHANTVIGSDGFGFAPSVEGWQKIHQLGKVIVGDDVEIGAATAIDRGALRDTEIARGVIIDNQVHIAHNVEIGEQTAIAGCVGIAGSSKIGARCTLGGYVAVNGHITITDDVHLHGGTIVTKSITEPGTYASCMPMQEVRQWRRNAVRYTQLDEWVARIKKIEKRSES